MNSDIAFEILRYFSPIDRCRLRLIDRSFNDGCLSWWRLSSREIDIGRSIDTNRRSRSKILSFLQFLSKYCTWTIRRLTNFLVDDQLLIEIVHQSNDQKSIDLRPLFNALESLEIWCLRMESYAALGKFFEFFKSSSISDLTLIGRYPMPVENWDGDETPLSAALIDLGDLRKLHLSEIELKGDILTSLSSDLTDLTIDRCPDIEEENLSTMVAWCLNLERVSLIDIQISLETFRQLCTLPRLSKLVVSVKCKADLSPDWIHCVCASDSIEEATLTGRIEGSFGDLLDSCPWPIMINMVDDTDFYCLYLQNPVHLEVQDSE